MSNSLPLKLAGISVLLCLTGCNGPPESSRRHPSHHSKTTSLEKATVQNEPSIAISPKPLIDADALEIQVYGYLAQIDEQLEDLKIAYTNAKKVQPKPKQKAKEAPITTSAHLCKGSAFTAMAEFLYWRAFEDQLLNILPIYPSVSGSTNIVQTNITSFKTRYDPGFKVGLGYDFRYDNWSVNAIYTYYQTRKSLSLSFDPNSGNFIILPTSQLPGSPLFTGQSVSSKWKLHYNILDGELSRSFFVSRRLALRPFAGIRGAWINQKIDTMASGSVNQTVSTPFIQQHLKHWGVGPRLGVDTHWLFCDTGLGLFFNASGSLLYSGYNYHFNDEDTTASSTIFYHTNYRRLCSNAELFAGLDYAYCWKDSEISLDSYIGYSVNYWWRENELSSLNDVFLEGDLGLQGLNIGLRVSF